MVWAVGVLLFWASTAGACLAGGSQISGGIEPAFTTCLGAASSCNNFLRTQFRLNYKPISRPGFSLRFRVLRAYQVSMDDDEDIDVGEEQQTIRFDPPIDIFDVKARFSAPDGRDHWEARAGYSYQFSNPNTSDGYHTAYISGQYYFGAPIASGWGGLSRRVDFLMRVTRNLYTTTDRPAEALVQFVPTYTVPVNGDGSTRVYASYARELRFSGSNNVRTPANRLEVGAYRNPTRWLELYARGALWGIRGISGTGRIVVGADVSI